MAWQPDQRGCAGEEKETRVGFRHGYGNKASLQREAGGAGAPARLDLAEDRALDGEHLGGVSQHGVGVEVKSTRTEVVASAGERLGLSERRSEQESGQRQKAGAERRTEGLTSGL